MFDASPAIARLPFLRRGLLHALLRRVWRVALRWRFRLFQRHRHNRLVVEYVEDRPLVILPDVFNPKLFRTGAFMAHFLDQEGLPSDATVLDMGTGSGIGAVAAARWTPRIDAVDINPHAVRCARINALLNAVDDRITVHHGDLFAPVQGRRFDVVLFNPPYFRGTPEDALDHAWRSDDVVERFAAALPSHLAPDGYALVVLSSDGDPVAFLDAFHQTGGTVYPVATRHLINETLMIFQVQVQVQVPGSEFRVPG